MKYALSSHQERLWFVDRYETGNLNQTPPTYYNLPLLLRGHGRLEGARVAAALAVVVGRHGALRTRIVTEGATGAQVIGAPGEVPVAEIDLGAAGYDEALARAVAEAQRPFRLQADPLLRANLWHFGGSGGEFLLGLTLHHLICDRASLRLVAEELAAVLRDPGRGLAAPELQYSDYSEWQRTLPADALEPLFFYWKWQLRGSLAALELPSARARPAAPSFTAARQTFAWPAPLVTAVRALAAQENAEPATVALAALQVLLHRYARQDEIVLGTSLPGRRQPGTERMIGPLANLVVLRGELGGNPEFRALLGAVTKTYREAGEHQELPFGALLLALDPKRDPGRGPLFDVLFTYDDTPPPVLDLGAGVSAQLIDTNLGYGSYDLNLVLRPGLEGDAAGAVVYNAELYDAWFVAQMMTHFTRIVAAVVANPAGRIDDVGLLDAAEERRQLEEWNATGAEAPREQTLHALFAAQVGRTPDRIAVSLAAESLSYAELDARANRLAHHLRTQGVGPDTLVAVCLERSLDLVAALLGVLKAGGAYLPLDPAYPRERLAFTVQDAQVRHLVTTAALADGGVGPVPHVTRLDAEAAWLALQPVTAPPEITRPEHLAYCIYTSGSTGQPKGTLLEHRQVTRLMINRRLPFTFGPADTWTLFHSCCFDFSVWEMFGALLYGGRLVVVPRTVAQDPAAFLQLVAREQVTVLNQTPTSFYAFAREALRQGAPLALRYVVFGGEALLPLQLRDFKRAYPATRLINMYGITETTVHVTYAEVTDEDIAENRCQIGGPIPTTTTYLMDAHLRLVPVGVPGEICVGGEGVGRGYLRREELTRQRFVANPYRPEERIYRSGDLARQGPDGRMIYLGRMDDQVQIRGFRVELGEIKTRLLGHPGVAGVEVIARPLLTETLELVAYCVPRGEVAVADLRRHLGAVLPEYMLPAAFVMLPALPLTLNGKVDRRALPEPAALPEGAGADYLAPRTATEEKLAAIFATLLRQERVGVNHNFFELGGHSMLATQLVSRVRGAFGLDLPLRQVFEAPTVGALAAVIDAGRSAGDAVPAAPAIGRALRRPRGSAAVS